MYYMIEKARRVGRKLICRQSPNTAMRSKEQYSSGKKLLVAPVLATISTGISILILVDTVKRYAGGDSVECWKFDPGCPHIELYMVLVFFLLGIGGYVHVYILFNI